MYVPSDALVNVLDRRLEIPENRNHFCRCRESNHGSSIAHLGHSNQYCQVLSL